MKLTAIDSETGKVLLSQSGSLRESDFKTMVERNFPHVEPSRIVIITDGRIQGKDADAQKRRTVGGKSVVWRGSFSDAGGYANLNREVCMRLPHHGFQVKIEMLKTAVQVDPSTYGLLRAMENAKIDDERMCPLVVGFTPMSVRAPGRRVAFYTMMETQGLHREFAKRCNISASEIWVPCHYYERVFKENGVIRPVHVIPLGVNDKTYRPDAPEPDLLYELMPTAERVHAVPPSFRFMSVFGWSYRKGPDVLCRAFLEEFDRDDGVSLAIYSRYMGSSAEVHKDHVRNEIRGYYEEAGKDNPPPIYYCGDAISIGDMPGCYAAADAFVFCSRGEGFALPVIEAGACGLPVISAYNTAMTDYLDDDVAFCVPPDGVAPANDKLCWISEYYRDQNFAVMGDKAVAEFKRHMRDAYENKKDAASKAEKFRDRVLKNYTWDLCAERVAARLNQE